MTGGNSIALCWKKNVPKIGMKIGMRSLFERMNANPLRFSAHFLCLLNQECPNTTVLKWNLFDISLIPIFFPKLVPKKLLNCHPGRRGVGRMDRSSARNLSVLAERPRSATNGRKEGRRGNDASSSGLRRHVRSLHSKILPYAFRNLLRRVCCILCGHWN